MSGVEFPPGLLVWTILWSLAIVICLIAAASALNERRGMSVRTRRNLAIGIALVAVALAWLELNFIINHPTCCNLVGDGYSFLQTDVPGLIIFYWIDAAVLVSRRADPLLRDTLHWSRVRIVLWGILLFSASVYLFVILLYFDVIVRKSIGSGFNGAPFGNNIITYLGSASEVLIPLLVAPIMLVIVWRRSRDPTIRKHLKWFAFAAIALLFGAIIGDTGGPNLTFGIIFAEAVPLGGCVAAYCLYKSARSLVLIAPSPAKSIDSSPSN